LNDLGATLSNSNSSDEIVLEVLKTLNALGADAVNAARAQITAATTRSHDRDVIRTRVGAHGEVFKIIRVNYLRGKRRRLAVAFIAAPGVGPLIFVLLQIIFVLLQILEFGDPGQPMPLWESAAVVWVLYAWPSYAGTLLFGLPLVLIYLRRGIISWLAYVGGGLLSGLITAIILILVSNRHAFLAQLNGLAYFVVLYGVAGGLCCRAILFGFKIHVAETPPHQTKAATGRKDTWIFLTLVAILPISPLIWLFAATHPYGIPSGPESVIVSLSAFAVSLAAPLYIGALAFGLLLTMLLRRFGWRSSVAYIVGGAANSLGIVILLFVLSRSAGVGIKPPDALIFIIGYGALSAIALYLSTRSNKDSVRRPGQGFQ
jgi:hypothetical protein